jgi:hypothetical protein
MQMGSSSLINNGRQTKEPEPEPEPEQKIEKKGVDGLKSHDDRLRNAGLPTETNIPWGETLELEGHQ